MDCRLFKGKVCILPFLPPPCQNNTQTPNKNTEQITRVQLELYSLKDGTSFVALSAREKKG